MSLRQTDLSTVLKRTSASLLAEPEGKTMEEWLAAPPDLTTPVAEMPPAAALPPVEVQQTEVVTFQDRANLLISRGIPVTPLRPKTKIAFIHEWETSASTSFEQIARWNTENPEYNCAAVAKAMPDGYWFFEVDSADVLKRIEAETGQKIPRTFRVRSSPQKGHFYWKQSAGSIAMGNLAQGYVNHADWSARVDRQYVCGPMSIHPRTGGVYEVISDAPIIEAPAWLISWCLSQKIEKKTAKPADDGGPILQSGRNNTLTSIGGSLRNSGLNHEEIESALLRINQERCQPPLDETEVMTIAASVSRYAVPDANPVLIGGIPVGSVQVASTASDTASSLQTKTANKITTKKIKWLWEQRIPFGKLSVLAGNPDQGKSLVTMYMVSQLTTGRPLYGSTVALTACEVLVLAGEDEANDTIVPRLQAGDADLSKVHLVEAVAVKDGKGLTVGERETQLDTDIQMIETMLKEHPQIRLVIVDPLSNYLGRANMNREQEVRQVLVPLKNLAARTGVAIVAVMHLNKSTDSSAIHRIGGAVAFTGVARAVWLFTEDPNDQQKHLMLRVKGNIAKSVGGLSYRIQAKPVTVEGSPEYQPYVEWQGETDQVASDVLVGGAPAGRPNEKIQTAKDWLADFLSKGSETATDVKKYGAKAGFTWRTIERAKADLHVVSEKPGSVWEWALPNQDQQETIEL